MLESREVELPFLRFLNKVILQHRNLTGSKILRDLIQNGLVFMSPVT
jgi:hypothetical protein